MKPEHPEELRTDFAELSVVETRWNDNDVYGHVNNVVYYAYFDTVINRYLIDRGGLQIAGDSVIGLCVESQCRFLESLSFPESLEIGLRVGRLGNSSVRYELGVFRAGADEACATGHFVHVFVDRATRKPVPIPAPLRQALMRLVNAPAS